MSDTMDFVRTNFLVRITENFGGAHIPGGDVAAWLAPVPTAVLALMLYRPADQVREILFAAVGMARLETRSGIDQNLFEGATTNLPTGATAEGALMAWAACRQARELLALGFAAEAQRALLSATRAADRWPVALAQRFEPQLCALYAEADRMRAHDLAHEVA